MVSAVFFDKDGVINDLVYHLETGEMGAPWSIDQIKLKPGIFDLMSTLGKHYLIFIVSNQPDAAKGNVTYEQLIEVLDWFRLTFNGLVVEFYFCLHHPSKCQCQCRKPGTLSIERAIEKYNIDPSLSYFIGDSDTDVMCAKKMKLNILKVM